MNFSVNTATPFSQNLSKLEGGLQSLLFLNDYLVQSVNQLLGDKSQEGSLLNILSSQQTQSLVQKIHTRPEMKRRLQAFSQINKDTLKRPSCFSVAKTVQNCGPKKGEYSFESGVFKKCKTNEEKDIIVCETRSDVSTECEFETMLDINESSCVTQKKIKNVKVTKTKSPKKTKGKAKL